MSAFAFPLAVLHHDDGGKAGVHSDCRAAEFIGELADAFFAGRGPSGPRWMLMLTVYLDDSGSHGGPFYVLGGYLASTERWKEFSREWQALLDEYPPLKCFKMSKAARKKDGDFTGITDERIRRFAECAKKHAELQVCSVVPRQEYERIVQGKAREVINSPYYLCFLGLVEEINAWASLRENIEPVAWFLDYQGGSPQRGVTVFEQRAIDSFFRVKAFLHEDERRLMKSIVCASDCDLDFLPLQAADMIASNIRRHLDPAYEPHPVHAFLEDGTVLERTVPWYPARMQALVDRIESST